MNIYDLKGKTIETWQDTGMYSPTGKNIGLIFDVFPYTGKYPQLFDCVLRISHNGLNKGYFETAYNSSHYPSKVI